MNWIVARLLCEDGTTIEVVGNAFQVKGAFANAATSAAPLSEGSAAVFASFCVRFCDMSL